MKQRLINLFFLVNPGTGFDCASRTEMKTVLSMGVAPSRIIYAHPCKIASHIKYARDNDVRRMTFDSSQELVKVTLLPQSGASVYSVINNLHTTPPPSS